MRAADTDQMIWLRAHLTAVVVVVIATTAAGGVMAFARPTYHPASTEKVVDVSKGPQFTTGQVMRAFAASGIRLTRTSGRITGASSFWDIHPSSKLNDGFLVTVWNPKAKIYVSTVDPKPRYERWIGNVDVFYGGRNEAFAARVAAAAENLSR